MWRLVVKPVGNCGLMGAGEGYLLCTCSVRVRARACIVACLYLKDLSFMLLAALLIIFPVASVLVYSGCAPEMNVDWLYVS